MAPPQEGGEHVVLLYLPLKRLRAMPRFLWYALLIMGQLRRSEGLIGYSLGARLSSLEFWSLSLWKDSLSAPAPPACNLSRCKERCNQRQRRNVQYAVVSS